MYRLRKILKCFQKHILVCCLPVKKVCGAVAILEIDMEDIEARTSAVKSAIKTKNSEARITAHTSFTAQVTITSSYLFADIKLD